MKVTDLKENEVIHCETLEQYDAICKLLHEAGFRWSTGNSFLEDKAYVLYNQQTCISPKEGKYCSKEWYEKGGYTIYPATAFITPTQTKEEYAKERAIGFMIFTQTNSWIWMDKFGLFTNEKLKKSLGYSELYDEYLKSLLQTQD